MQTAELILLLVALPFAVWATWMDFKYMRLPNKMNLLIVSIFVVLGIFMFPLEEYFLRLGIGLAVLLVGFGMMLLRMIGGGDVKYLAAILPYISPGNIPVFVILLSSALIIAFGMHRLAKSIPAFRNSVPDWKSWRSRKFPMGFAISGAWLLYLATSAFNISIGTI